ncbi:hypothetical protein [Bernardetia sp.]|uniref:hypothetical protein n=1 Tax=Bernardetia sp. TaxID=1937974 RepID=UPI0025BCCE32|nr:hypothetical protein [Bernardetia sp.]
MKQITIFIACVVVFISLLLSQFKVIFCETGQDIWIRGKWYDKIDSFIYVVDEPNEYDYEIGEYDFFSEKPVLIISLK